MIRKNFWLLLGLSLFSTSVFAQFEDPVKWDTDFKKVSATEYDLIIKAKIDDGWVIYSQNLPSEDGPIPTTFYWDEGDHYELIGDNLESGTIKSAFDKIFEMEVVKISKEGFFTQRVKVSDISKPISGAVEFMTCDDSHCLPPTEVPFEFLLSETAVNAQANKAQSPEVDAEGFPVVYGTPPPDMDNIASTCSTKEDIKSSSLWKIFGLGMLGGFIALLTPCVFPMIPLTVSFFTKSSTDKAKGFSNAAFYGLSIIGIYILLSVPFHLMDSVNPDVLNEISTNVWLNLLFFAVFLIFAFSFFGFYEITLPSSWTNKSSSAESIGGGLGIFFMALTLVLVSFSCTGPILGTLLVGALSSDGGAMQLTAGMGGFGLALALPFAAFAAFPGWMNSLPKSGGWLNTVKVCLGFIEFALAFKFLSNADMVAHWNLLKIEPFLIIWILCALGMGLYLFGFIRFPHDSPVKKRSIPKVLFGALSLVFAAYLVLGFRYNEDIETYEPLTVLSGIAPPVCYSYVYPCDCPQGLNCYKDYKEGMAHAKSVNKPVLIDFTGYACVNCRKMEEHIWPRQKVYKYLTDDYVLISLYVDDKKPLPEAEQKFVQRKTGGVRQLKDYGDRWATFQEYFGANSQPYYVLMSPDGKVLNRPVGYTPDEEEYSAFLQCGLDAFKGMLSERK